MAGMDITALHTPSKISTGSPPSGCSPIQRQDFPAFSSGPGKGSVIRAARLAKDKVFGPCFAMHAIF